MNRLRTLLFASVFLLAILVGPALAGDLATASATSSAGPSAIDVGLTWLLGVLKNPLLYALAVPLGSRLIARHPAIDATKAGPVVAIASLLTIAGAVLMAIATGQTEGLDLAKQLQIGGEALIVLLTAFLSAAPRPRPPQVVGPSAE